MPDNPDNGTHDDTHGDADGGGVQLRASGAAPAARADLLSPLLIALLGAMALGLIFFLAPLMVRVRAGARQQSGGQTGGAPAGNEQNGKPNDLPLGPRQDVALGDAPVRGSRNAPMMIVEFADYQCPYCQQMHPELKILQQELAGKVAVAFKDFPLAMHANAEKAAEAARCAGEQGKYWDFHDVLFHNSENLEVAQIKQYAHDLKLNQANFDACLDSGKEAAAVQKDEAQGKQLGVRATPSFFFNGRLFTGSMDYFTLRSIVEMLLKTDAPAAAAARGAARHGAGGNDAGYDVTPRVPRPAA
jgi:protein-disulfide isomerase